MMTNPIPELQGSSYYYVNSFTINNRQIHQYLLKGTSTDDVARAKQAMTQLWGSHDRYFSTFNVPVDDDAIRNNPHLIINGRAVCISDTPPTGQIKYADLFSRALAKNPTRCSHGHLLERERAEYWSRQSNGMCLMGDHAIGPIVLDEVMQEKIRIYLIFNPTNQSADTSKAIRVAEAIGKKENDELEVRADRNEEIAIRQEAILNRVAVQTTACLGKVAFKVSTRAIAKAILKNQAKKQLIKGGVKITEEAIKSTAKAILNKQAEALLKEEGKEIAKKAVKNASEKCLLGKLPLISLGFGLAAGCYRTYQGDYLGAFGEVTSGAVACLPGYGTAISTGIDIILVGRDIYNATTNMDELDQSIESDDDDILNALGLDPSQPITKEKFDKKFNKIVLPVHPDKNNPGIAEEMTEITRTLIEWKESIYKKNNWRNG